MNQVLSLVVVASLAVLSGCARPSQRIAAELQQQGLDPASAQCIGNRMDERLSVSQLLRLRGALRRYRDRAGDGVPVDFAGLATMARDVGDPQIVLETIGAGLTCGMQR